jgi:hypothetical protein
MEVVRTRDTRTKDGISCQLGCHVGRALVFILKLHLEFVVR